MPVANTPIFVGFRSTDLAASAECDAWSPAAAASCPADPFELHDGTEGPTANLRMGTCQAANGRPHPEPAGWGRTSYGYAPAVPQGSTGE